MTAHGDNAESNLSNHSSVTTQKLMQMRAMYKITTQITNKCFETCMPRLNPRLEEAEKNCLANCSAAYLHMKLLFTKRLIDVVHSTQLDERI